MFAGDAVFPNEFTGAPDAQCFQGMQYSPMNFTGAPDAQCLQGMPYSPMKFTGVPDAQCFQGMPYSPMNFTGAQMPNVCRGCSIPRWTSLGHRCPMFAGDAHCDNQFTLILGVIITPYFNSE